MRKRTFGLLALCLSGRGLLDVPAAHGQGYYQEPVPIQAPALGYGGGYLMPGQAMPGQAMPRFPAGLRPGYAPPIPVAAGYPVAMLPPVAGMQQAAVPLPPPGAYYVLPAAATQEKLDPPRKVEPRPLPQAPISVEAAPAVSTPPAPPEQVTIETADGLPAEPAEPYMVRPEGSWKPAKGYSIYGSADFLIWNFRAQPVPPNLSLSSAPATSALGLSNEWHPGGRFLLGTWMNPQHDLAIEGGYTFLADRTTSSSRTFPARALAIPPIFAGTVNESSRIFAASDFSGAEVNLRHQIWSYQCEETTAFAHVLGGFRFADLSEAFGVSATTRFGPSALPLANRTLTATDAFGTHNTFLAGQIGTDVGVRWHNLSATAFAKLAMGNDRQTVVINGFSTVAGPPAVGTFGFPGGFYAQPSNIGRHRHDTIGYLPELGLNLGYHLGDHVRLGFGYNYLSMSNVVRPGDQIDVRAGGATRPGLFFITGTPRPAFDFRETTFWAQGINLTVEVVY